ncbi:hypothetical protein RintRC_4050 [Richelia intracellularis]|nr:hypothetical protein RintRC_4050 [Richelia intracellularis]
MNLGLGENLSFVSQPWKNPTSKHGNYLFCLLSPTNHKIC